MGRGVNIMAIIEHKVEALTKEELEERVKNYFQYYHPSGYCTIDHGRGERVDADGVTVYYANITRLSSCD